MSAVKVIIVEDFYSKETAEKLAKPIFNLEYSLYEFGMQINNFNLIPKNANQLFSTVLSKSMNVIEKESGIFRIPKHFIHFESFESTQEWMFVVALQNSTFNIYEHITGNNSALNEFHYNYRNLFEWNLTTNFLLQPGQCVLFRPWLFHSFDAGLIQLFRLKENNN